MKSVAKPVISKIGYFHGTQCLKKLYLYTHQAKVNVTPDTPSCQTTNLIHMGHKVGLLARELFPNGVDCSSETVEEQLQKTHNLIDAKCPVLYEAAFKADNLFCSVDILKRQDDGRYCIYEVKSGTKLTDDYEEDIVFQYHVCKIAGLPLSGAFLTYINNSYRRRGKVDVSSLFSCHEMSVYDMDKMRNRLVVTLATFDEALSSPDIPKIPVGPHCSKPHDCMYKSHCNAEISLPEYSVLNLVNDTRRKWDLLERNIKCIEDIPPDIALTVPQQVQVICEKTKQPHVNVAKVQRFLSHVKYPAYFLDFETVTSPIPVYDNTQPYQQICTQYSLHSLSADNELCHAEYLAPTSQSNNVDPRVAVLRNLIKDVGTTGTILVYSSFEVTRLSEMAKEFPAYKPAVDAILRRIVDLAVLFREKAVYYSAMRGKYSIKYVFPALFPDLSYEGLAIKDGSTANHVFLELVQGEYSGDVEQARKDLLEYCKLDTYAMVKIFEKLQEFAKS